MGQQRVVGHKRRRIGSFGLDLRATEVLIDFTADVRQCFLDRSNGIRLLLKDYLANDSLNIGVRECNGD